MYIFRKPLFCQPDLVDIGTIEDIKAYSMLQSIFFFNLMKKPTPDNLIRIGSKFCLKISFTIYSNTQSLGL